ncbi:hypothetical protein BESB_029970 [Besnoitia besnoiti]|uniref:Tubulin/FtsZ GTPase domain-containing protein n=1 Tax=Besnoitia besnoiti TaxID=94643 RepID=A0A2A9M644_BESBE|nr:hypothetical protein BESB_029970 [Besnoitia besnoiti]PFH31123.1 hypothetical protein BESB_029970 [Besnoitia besnoiti]
MPREVVVFQIGQCGNQIGSQFWQTVLEEHAAAARARAGATAPGRPPGLQSAVPLFDASMSTFFRNVDARHPDYRDLRGDDQPIKTLKARAILIDTEEGVLNAARRSALGSLFDERQIVADVSGAGNNCVAVLAERGAHGYCEYGRGFRPQLCEAARRALEHADSIQAFLLLHSLGGGTGSGLGSYVVEMLAEELPEVPRFCCSIVPSPVGADDVVTSPYNSVLALAYLREHASCVLPVSNDALIKICEASEPRPKLTAWDSTLPRRSRTPREGERVDRRRPRVRNDGAFDKMNGLVARALAQLTCSLRFDGSLSVDLDDITTNLVPYPGLHFLLSSLAPLAGVAPERGAASVERTFAQRVADLLASSNQLFASQPMRSLCLASAFLARGPLISVSSLIHNVAKLRRKLRLLSFNQDATRFGLCAVAPQGQPYGLLALLNSCEVAHLFSTVHGRFNQLFTRKAHLHHYDHYMDRGAFEAASESVLSLVADYSYLNRTHGPSPAYLPASTHFSRPCSLYAWPPALCAPR